jgi:hypothetical protein
MSYFISTVFLMSLILPAKTELRWDCAAWENINTIVHVFIYVLQLTFLKGVSSDHIYTFFIKHITNNQVKDSWEGQYQVGGSSNQINAIFGLSKQTNKAQKLTTTCIYLPCRSFTVEGPDYPLEFSTQIHSESSFIRCDYKQSIRNCGNELLIWWRNISCTWS